MTTESFWVLLRTEKEYELFPQQDEKWKIFSWEPVVGSTTIRYKAIATVIMGIDMESLTIKQDGKQILVNSAGPKVLEPIAVVGQVTDLKRSGMISPDGYNLPDFAQASVRQISKETVCASEGRIAKLEAEKRLVELIKAIAPELEPVVLVGEPQC